MARYYRRRRGYYKRRFLKRRFGVGGGNRKRPSSYSVAYGFTKQFDKLVRDWASNLASVNYGDLYSKPSFLAAASNVFLNTEITETDKAFLDVDQAALANQADRNAYFTMIHQFFVGPANNHVENIQEMFAWSSRHVRDGILNAAAIDAARQQNALHDAHAPGAPAQRVAVPQAIHFNVITPFSARNINNDNAALLIALKTQMKDALLKITKRNLPFALAISSWAYSFLKYKKKRKKYLNFWKWKSVPRFMILCAFSLKQIWSRLKYGSALSSLYTEIDFVRQTLPRRRLLELAQAGVAAAQAELGRQAGANINDARPVIRGFVEPPIVNNI